MRGLITLSLLPACLWAFSCMDQSGKPVDWFAVYKMPIVKDNSIPGVADGVGWYYLDVNKKSSLQPSAKTLDDKDQAIAYTLQQYYDKKSDKTIFHAMYNDEPYGTVSVSGDTNNLFYELFSNRINPKFRPSATDFGHTKGTLFFDKTSGIWLVHSVPKFPPPDGYAYPTSGHDYGQTMLCMTFKYSELNKIGTQLYFNRPNIYSSFLPTDMASANPDLAKAIAGQYATGQPSSSIIDLTTSAGTTFKSFAKSKDFNADLYDSIVAPTLKTDMLVESWRRGSAIPLACSKAYHANDALSIKVE
ncbi:hypothetical protein WR25_14551 [Diploscapter pachys]|uniref:Uncharacterized protein n=1 Tax=Diploscapter pachys TaxID=2018661 RepID=A0A2A2L4X8_9BILA|nr:hypothetical protein WR25_14551 [Diploscapter pachys]